MQRSNRRHSNPSRQRLSAVAAALVCISALWLTPPRPAQAIPVFDITNLVQNIVSAIQGILEVSQQVTQLSNEATQIANDIRMLQDFANQARMIGSPSWGQVQASINALATAAQVGNALIYNMPGIAGQMQTQFPGYQAPVNWNTEYQQYATTTIDTMRGTLESAGLNISDVNSVESALNALRSANNGATGSNELAQVANSLASLEIAELTKMRQ